MCLYYDGTHVNESAHVTFWPPHMALDGLRYDDVYLMRKPENPNHESRITPGNIELHLIRKTRVTGYPRSVVLVARFTRV